MHQERERRCVRRGGVQQ
jgi:hypothetical protein